MSSSPTLGLWAFAALCCACSQAWAQPVPFNPEDWRKYPSEAEIVAAWPQQARAELYAADVLLECDIDQKGSPRDCSVTKEDQQAQGSGAAALSLAGKFRMKRSRGQRAYIEVSLHAPGYVQADWLKRPRPEDLATVWPTAALKAGKGGRTVISCSINTHGSLFDCKVLLEEPEGLNFGGAAIALTTQFPMKPATFNGKPVVSSVRMPIVFETPGNYSGASVSPVGMKTVVDPARAWLAAPSHADVVAAYPKKARGVLRAGRATLSCGFNSQGGLKACDILTEEPKNQGFGEAAKDLAKLFRADPGPSTKPNLNGLLVQLPVSFTTEMLGSEKLTIGKPRWVQLPSAEEVAGVYPAAAMRASVWSGRASLSCQVQAEGKAACVLQSETPTGYGFGDAALKIAPHFRLATWTIEGLPVIGGTVRIPIKFEAPDVFPTPAP